MLINTCSFFFSWFGVTLASKIKGMQQGHVDLVEGQEECHVGFESATWMMVHLGTDLCKVLLHKTLNTGYLLGKHLTSNRSQEYIAIAHVIHHEEGSGGLCYVRTGERVLFKAFTDAAAAQKEAYLTLCACSGGYKSTKIVRLVGLLADESFSYIVQEFVPGGDLLDRLLLAESTPVPQSMVRTWFVDLIEALIHLQRRGIAHMDISPEVII